MKALRHAAILAWAMGAALCVRAADDRTGPQPAEVIFPRGEEAAAIAQESSGAAASPVFAPAPSLGGTLPAAGYVIALLALVGGAWYLLKRGSLPRPFSKTEGKLHVLETRMLGNRQFLVVVEYEDAKMLLGVCQGRIDYLTPLTGHLLAAGAAGEEDEPVPAAVAAAVGERR